MRFDDAEEAERFWKAQKDHVEVMSDLRWYVGERADRVEAGMKDLSAQVTAVDRRVVVLEAEHKAAARREGSAAGRNSGAKWAAAIVAVVELLKMVAPAMGHPWH